MKRTTKKLSKMQRKARSKRKTWTNAKRFEVKHEREVAEQLLQAKAMKRWLKEMQAQMAIKEAEGKIAADAQSAETSSDVPMLTAGTDEVVLGDEVLPAQEG